MKKSCSQRSRWLWLPENTAYETGLKIVNAWLNLVWFLGLNVLLAQLLQSLGMI
jgi:hypothetical protein